VVIIVLQGYTIGMNLSMGHWAIALLGAFPLVTAAVKLWFLAVR